MKKSIYILPLVLLLASCNNEEQNAAFEQDEIRFNIVHPSAAVTRVTETHFDQNDKVGVYLTGANKPLDIIGNYIDNASLTYNGSIWAPSSKIYWNNGTYDAYAYYPYNADVKSIDDYTFNVNLDQSTAANYSASDFLWASSKSLTASDQGVQLLFKHKMSRMMITLQKSANYEGEIPDDAEVYIHNTVPESTIDLGVGIPTKNPKGTAKTIRAYKHSRGKYSAIIVPQRLSSRVPLVEVIANGVSYLYEAKFLFQSGIQHNVALTISKNPEQIKIELGGEIINW